MATEAIYTKSLGGAEDLLLDASNSPTVIQTRAGKELEITKINSSTIPYSGKFGDPAMVSIKDQLDSSAYVIDTVEDLATFPSGFDTVIVKDINRGGTFVSKTEVDIDQNTGSLYTANDGTIFAKAGGGFWVRQYSGAVNVKWFGAVINDDNDGSIFVNCISNFNNIVFDNDYTFIFDKTSIIINHKSLYIEGKGTTQTFKNFGGITATNCKEATINISIDAENTYFQGLLTAVNLEKFNSEILEIKNVINTQDVDPSQTFILEVSAQTSNNSLNLSCNNIILENIYTVGLDLPSARAMTFLGGYGSSGTSTEKMIINIKNIRVLNFYTTNSSGDIIGGDSDVFRLFTQNTLVSIDNLYVKNSGKRIFKTQEKATISIKNAVIELDSRFTSLNFNGIFEGQYANSLEPTLFNISNLCINIAEEDIPPATLNSNGLGHSIVIDYLSGTNFSAYCIDEGAKIEIKNSDIDGFIINNTLGDSFITNANITNFRGVNTKNSFIRDSTLYLKPSYSGTGFLVNGATLENVNFDSWNTNIRVAEFKSMKNIKINYTYGTTKKRAFHGIGSKLDTIDGLVITTTGAIYDVPLETDGLTGNMSVKNFRNDLGIQLGYYTSGTWSFWLDNCNGHTVTGAGATVKTVSYI